MNTVFSFFNLIAILGSMSVKARFVLIEIDQEQVKVRCSTI